MPLQVRSFIRNSSKSGGQLQNQEHNRRGPAPLDHHHALLSVLSISPHFTCRLTKLCAYGLGAVSLRQADRWTIRLCPGTDVLAKTDFRVEFFSIEQFHLQSASSGAC
uniref:Uncharacterized protein n=1 Tax=Macrostomum lignano TaxID=282301 RepID=A0A1I8F897_9PLAT